MTSVNILVTVRGESGAGLAMRPALLVFKTLRAGFPTLPVNVFGNGLGLREEQAVRKALPAGSQYVSLARTSHDAWIEQLILRAAGPIWICDTDVVFFENVEMADGRWQMEGECLAGRLEPEFIEPWTGTVHVEWLHTCLMFLDVPRLRAAMAAWAGQWNEYLRVFPGTEMELVRQGFVPKRRMENGERRTEFYDTCAGLWQAGIGTPFTAEQNGAFEHLHCGTYVNEIGRCKELKDLRAVHEAIYAEPARARGLQFEQGKFYERQAVNGGNGKRTSNVQHSTSNVERGGKKGKQCLTIRE